MLCLCLSLSLSVSLSIRLSLSLLLSGRLSFLFCYFSFCASINFTAAPSCHVSPTFSYGFRFSHNVSFIWFWFSLAALPEPPTPTPASTPFWSYPHLGETHRRDFDTAKREAFGTLVRFIVPHTAPSHIHTHTGGGVKRGRRSLPHIRNTHLLQLSTP